MPQQLAVFPAFFRVAQKRVAVLVNGDEALAHVRLLLNTEASHVVFDDAPKAEFAQYLRERAIEHIAAAFAPEQLDGAILVFAATGNVADDQRIVIAARERKIPAN